MICFVCLLFTFVRISILCGVSIQNDRLNVTNAIQIFHWSATRFILCCEIVKWIQSWWEMRSTFQLLKIVSRSFILWHILSNLRLLNRNKSQNESCKLNNSNKLELNERTKYNIYFFTAWNSNKSKWYFSSMWTEVSIWIVFYEIWFMCNLVYCRLWWWWCWRAIAFELWSRCWLSSEFI